MELEQALRERRSIRAFRSDPVPEEERRDPGRTGQATLSVTGPGRRRYQGHSRCRRRRVQGRRPRQSAPRVTRHGRHHCHGDDGLPAISAPGVAGTGVATGCGRPRTKTAAPPDPTARATAATTMAACMPATNEAPAAACSAAPLTPAGTAAAAACSAPWLACATMVSLRAAGRCRAAIERARSREKMCVTIAPSRAMPKTPPTSRLALVVRRSHAGPLRAARRSSRRPSWGP